MERESEPEVSIQRRRRAWILRGHPRSREKSVFCTGNFFANERFLTGLYTDESPGLKVDPVVVLVLSLVFIFSVVALHSMLTYAPRAEQKLNIY